MKKIIHLFRGFLISSLLLFVSCIHRAPSLRMLDERSEYGKEGEKGRDLKLQAPGMISSSDGETAGKTRPKTANIWIFPKETEGKEVFWGGWVTVRLEDERLELMKPNDLQREGVPKIRAKQKSTKKKKESK